jgi:hypothetical protein
MTPFQEGAVVKKHPDRTLEYNASSTTVGPDRGASTQRFCATQQVVMYCSPTRPRLPPPAPAVIQGYEVLSTELSGAETCFYEVPTEYTLLGCEVLGAR